MILIRSLIFNIYFYGLTVVFLSVSFFVVLTRHQKTIKCIAPIWSWLVIKGAKIIAGIDYQIKGSIPNSPVILACKHHSAWDTIIFFILVKHPSYILKKELLRIPVYGSIIRYSNHIVVDRKKGRLALRNMIADAKKIYNNQSNYVIFPEGTRVGYGETPSIGSGTYGLYKALECPCIPVALDSGKCWGRNRFMKYPGTITLRFHEPLAANFDKKTFNRNLHKQINSL